MVLGTVVTHRGFDEGASAVEFALLLPILIMLLFGIISGGFLFNQQLSVTQAAREAARYGATSPIDGGSVPCENVPTDGGQGQSWANEVEQVALGALGPLLNEDNANVFVRCYQGDVEVVVHYPSELDVILYRFEPTVGGRSVARYEVN